MISLSETIQRQEEELEKIKSEAKLKYRTDNLESLSKRGDSGPQQFEDKKAVVFQMETLTANIEYLKRLEGLTDFINQQEEINFEPLINEIHE